MTRTAAQPNRSDKRRVMVDKNTAPNTDVEPGAEPEAAKSTTEQLFGDVAPAVEATPEGTGGPNAAVEAEPVAPPEPAADPTKKSTEYLSSEDFSGRKVKTKVDGVEKEISFEELLKGYQLNETIAERGQKLGTERQALAEERKNLEELRQKVDGMVQGGLPAQAITSPQTPNVDFDMMDEVTKNAFISQQTEHDKAMAEITQKLQQISVGLQPIQLEQGYRQMDTALKAENPAFDDFMGKVAEIESFIINLPVDRQAEYGTPLGYMSVYKDIKNKELLAVSATGTESPTLIPRTEGGSGAPTGIDAGGIARSKELFSNAVEASKMKDIRDFQTVDPMREWGKVLNDMS